MPDLVATNLVLSDHHHPEGTGDWRDRWGGCAGWGSAEQGWVFCADDLHGVKMLNTGVKLPREGDHATQ